MPDGHAKPGMSSLRPIKEAVQDLPSGHPLREVVLAEPDELPAEEYAAKAMVWARLAIVASEQLQLSQ